MKGVQRTVRFLLALPAAYFGGNIAFGIIATGAWLPYVLAIVLKPRALDVILEILLWLARLIVFAWIVAFWVFDDQLQGDGRRGLH